MLPVLMSVMAQRLIMDTVITTITIMATTVKIGSGNIRWKNAKT